MSRKVPGKVVASSRSVCAEAHDMAFMEEHCSRAVEHMARAITQVQRAESHLFLYSNNLRHDTPELKRNREEAEAVWMSVYDLIEDARLVLADLVSHIAYPASDEDNEHLCPDCQEKAPVTSDA